MTVQLDKKISVARGCRLRETADQATTLQIPEGQMKMSGAGIEIIKLCDGNLTAQEIINTLKSKYPDSFHERIELETLSFLNRLMDKAVLSYI